MTLPLRFGYKASAEQFAPTELLEPPCWPSRPVRTPSSVSDHLQPWNHEGGHTPAAMPWLGALGAHTERIIMGTSVLTPTFRYHPRRGGSAFGTLGVLYPRSVILGVGTGEALDEDAALGIPWPDVKERFARLKEALELIDLLWREDRVTLNGQYFQTENATIYDRPDVPRAGVRGTSGPAATRLAGRVASGFITTSGKARELYADAASGPRRGTREGRPHG